MPVERFGKRRIALVIDRTEFAPGGKGAVTAMAAFPAAAWSVPAAAFLGAVLAVATVYRLSRAVGQRLDTKTLILAGVVVGAFTGAIMTAAAATIIAK